MSVQIRRRLCILAAVHLESKIKTCAKWEVVFFCCFWYFFFLLSESCYLCPPTQKKPTIIIIKKNITVMSGFIKKKKSRTTDGLHKNFTSHLNFQLFLWLPYLQWWNRVVHNVHIPEESETKATPQHFFWVMIMEWVYWMQIRCWWSLKMSFSDQLHQII